jgi:Na+/proline symporter
VLSGFIVFAQFTLFLLIGVALRAFYTNFDTAAAPAKGDEAFMTFVISHMSTGLKGLIVAAVLAATMSNLSASFNSSASALMGDWLQRWLPNMSDRTSLRVARWLTLASAVVHALVAIVAYEVSIDSAIVDLVLKIAGFSIGLLLGLYALGLIWPQTSERTALIAFAVGAAVTCYVAFKTDVNGYWYTLVGSSTIVIAGLVLSSLIDRPKVQANET